MALQTRPKLLRVGVIQDGRIVEEHHLLHDSVTIGEDARNTIVMPPSEARPPRFKVLENRGQQFHLIIDEHMQGRVNLGSSDVDFDALRSQGLATRRADDTFDLPLQESARGKVDLPDATLFFHFIPAPAEGSKPTLPPELKASPWRTVDRVFFGILLSMLVLYVLSVALIVAQPAPVEAEVELDQLEDRFVRAIIPPQPAKVEEPKDPGNTPEKKADEPKPDPKKTNAKDPAPAPANSAERRQQVEAKVSGTGLLKLLGGKGPGGGDAIADVLGSSGSGANVADALAGATSGGALTAGSGGGNGIANPQGDTGGKMAGIGATQTSGAGTVDTGRKQVVKVPQVADSVPEVDSAEVKPKDLARYIQSRKASIQRCYENGLKRDPSLKGRVMVRFNLTPQGRASDVEVEESTLRSDEVINCIKTTMRAWTFPFKPSDDVPVSYPFIFSPGE
ncbi:MULTISPECIES: AgmX/PglI C-terminal domain-containing protein [unclassified Corallococcus]|uniref:AgmX/PglI C-terminal domain-containing protein n=1 Tax=unclassified Corallococcus TaxID=2685029 RepID=UPI001A8F7E50|nr:MULTISPECIES: AgmX/PglI C-terminal domain-containing protein [unclassified Corallococcus]MBN9687349.1 energy transducer TonB [Corallococcus sp. NCSPR001]WAS88829.1 AgmX/PglI C-terminal domain-containing protein [Corallococcus sp. NCRR]